MTALVWTIGVVVLAAGGAVIRWRLADACNGIDVARDIPWGTLGVNVAASFLLGLLHDNDSVAAAIVGVAFCGALSTFSTLVAETVQLIEGPERWRGVVYLTATLLLGCLAAWTGTVIGG